MKKLASLFLACVMMCTTLTGCGPKYEKFSEMLLTQQYFNTVITVISYQKSQEDFDEMMDYVDSEFNRLNQLYDIYYDYPGVNNIKTINDNAGVAPVKVDKDIISMLKFAKEWHDKSGGRMNIALGSVLKVWHDAREEYDFYGTATLPDIQLLKEKAEHTDINNMIIDEENSTVFLSDPKMSLDVGAIAKGYAVEQIAQDLEEKGITGYLLNVGGNVRTVGMAGEKPWNVGIENPDKEDEETPHIEFLHMQVEALVTSGTYQRYYYVDGEKYHHIIDPATLMPGSNYMSVSVLAANSGVGDAFSTALFLLSYEDGLALVEAMEDVEAMWVLPDGEQRYSSGFKAYTYVPNS